jgi:hypothetical protein
MKLNLKTLMLGVVASVPFALTGCAPECVDVYDCGAKARKDGKEYTCVAGACVTGSPFPDAGSGETGGGGGETGGGGGETGGGGGATGGGGGGGGMDEDAGMDAGTEDAGMDVDAGMDAGMDVDAGMDAGMDVDAGMDAGMDVDAGMDAGIDAGVDAGTPSEQIAAVRSAIDLSTDAGVGQLTIRGAYVSYLKPLAPGAGTLADGGSTNDPAGFFLQASQNGPALFIAVDPSTVAGGLLQGDTVDLTVDTVKVLNGLRVVTAISSVTRMATTPSPISGLVASATAADFLATGTLDGFESRLVSFDGVSTTEAAAIGSGYKGINFNTTGTPDAGSNLRLRMPTALADAQYFGPGCTFTVTGVPMWRFTGSAQPSPFVQSEITNIVCPAPAPISAASAGNTSATVNFNRDLQSSTVTAGAFTAVASDGGVLAVTAATASSARTVALTTGAQIGDEPYTVTVASTVQDMRGTGVSSSANSATFTGAAGSVCAPGVVISQIYGRSNVSGSTFRSDFVELHNRTSAPVNIGGWTLQYASATNTTTFGISATIPANTTIAAGGYFLIQTTTAAGSGTALTADLVGNQDLSGSGGKVLISTSTTPVTVDSTGCPTTASGAPVVDFVGFGTANCREGTGTANNSPAATVSTDAIFRNTASGATAACNDSNVNSADFSTAPAAPRNSASPANTCTCP